MIAIPADPNNGLAIAAGAMAFVVVFPVILIWALGWERVQVWRGVRQIRRSRRHR